MDVKYQVFISSTYNDLKEERQEVIKVVLQMGHIPVSMEFFSAADEDQWSLINGLLDECDYYIVIIGGIYGSIEKKSGKSYTQLEYEYAVEKGIPVIGILNRDFNSLPTEKRERKKVNQEKLAGFSELVKRKMCQFWTTPSDLASNVATSLHRLMYTNPRLGWKRVLPDHKHPIERKEQIIKVDIPKPLNVISNEILNETDIRKGLKKGESDFGYFIESYFVIEGLYSHSNTEAKLPNSQLEWIRKNEIPAHLQQVSEAWTRAYRSIHTFIRIRDIAQKRGDPRDVISICNIFISYIYYFLTELWGDVPYFDKPELEIAQLGSSDITEIRVLCIGNLQSALRDKTLSYPYHDLAVAIAIQWELQAKDYSKAKGHIEQLINVDRYRLAPFNEVFSTDNESIGYFDTDQEASEFHNPVFKALCKKGRFVHYIRYTEVLLMATEIYFNLSDQQKALFYINLVRVRNDQPKLNEMGNNFIATLLEEWKENLGMEGSYFSALKRNGYAEKVLGIPTFKLVLPIPAQEIALNPNMRQNEGY